MKYLIATLAALSISTSISNGAPTTALSAKRTVVRSALTAGWAPTSTQAIPLQGSLDLGPMPPAAPMHVVVALRGNDAGADALLRHIYTKGDPQYRHFLKPAQFAAMFAPSPAAASAGATYLASSGMGDVKVAPN